MTANADWRDALKDKVQQFWHVDQRALVLSRVPAVLREAGISVEELLEGRKLRPFLEAEGAEHFRLIQSEKNPMIWGILPTSTDVGPPFDPYLYRPQTERPRRFAPGAWKAFITPLEVGRRRWLTDEPSVQYVDLPEDEAPPAGYEIDRRFIVDAPAEGEVGIALIISKIGEWAGVHNLDPARFELGRRKPPIPKADRAHLDSRQTALDQLLGLLLPTELTRVSVPLDVVARLRATKAREE